MGYLFLGLANLCGAIKGYCGKKVSSSVKKTSDATLANLLRMVLCVFIGFFVVLLSGGFKDFSIGTAGTLISLLSGISNAVFVISWLFAVSAGAYMLVDAFLTLGLAVPIALCSVFFGENIEWNHLVGFAILLLAVTVMCSYSSSIKAKISVKSLSLLLLCGVSYGLASFSQKWFAYESDGGSIAAFNFYTYLFAATVLLAAFLALTKIKRTENDEDKKSFTLKPVWYFIVVMAVTLFANSYLMTLAATKLDAVLIYPLSTGLGLLLSTLMCSIFFKERITARCVVGISLSFCAIIFINFL